MAQDLYYTNTKENHKLHEYFCSQLVEMKINHLWQLAVHQKEYSHIYMKSKYSEKHCMHNNEYKFIDLNLVSKSRLTEGQPIL